MAIRHNILRDRKHIHWGHAAITLGSMPEICLGEKQQWQGEI